MMSLSLLNLDVELIKIIIENLDEGSMLPSAAYYENGLIKEKYNESGQISETYYEKCSIKNKYLYGQIIESYNDDGTISAELKEDNFLMDDY